MREIGHEDEGEVLSKLKSLANNVLAHNEGQLWLCLRCDLVIMDRNQFLMTAEIVRRYRELKRVNK